MKLRSKAIYVNLLCGSLVAATAGAQTAIDTFEKYPDNAALLAAWSAATATLSLSTYVSPQSIGTNSMRVDCSFPASAGVTEILTGPTLPTPLVIASTQYLSLRISGDTQFTNDTDNTLYLYAYDGSGNFGRWGQPVPTTNSWQVFNFFAGSIDKPSESPALPDFDDIVQFKFFICGQGSPAGAAYSATVYLDDVMLRNTPLVEFPPPSTRRWILDNFEGYADDAALLGFYTLINDSATTVTTSSLETPAPEGSKALKLAIDFAPGQYPWGGVRSASVPTFSIPTNAVVRYKFKGDPTLAPVADDGTVFRLTFYDRAGSAFSFAASAAIVTSSGWTTATANYSDFWSTTNVDTGNLVGWQILVEGWAGTPATPARSGVFYVDDLRVNLPPVLTVVQQGKRLQLLMSGLIPGTSYTLRQTTNFAQPVEYHFSANSYSQTYPIPVGQVGFYQLYYSP